jgi:ATP-dependent helicase/nuclease subunit A
MEISRDEVRVMTVHGAKGLEAPIVILADTTTPPAGPPQRQPRFLALARKGTPPDTPGPLVWLGRKDDDVPLTADARRGASEAAENEHRRLLYVAMTRAADRLVVCGAVGERGKPPGCWYDLVHGALTPAAAEEPADEGEGTVWRLRGSVALAEIELAKEAAIAAGAASERPAWLDQNAPTELPPERAVSPSTAEDEGITAGIAVAGGATERIKALARGTLMHRLLQALPAIPPEWRAQAAYRHLARSADLFSDAERSAMVEQVRVVLEDPRFGDLFAAGSRAEVPIVGRIAVSGRAISVSGQVDRLAVMPGGVLIADYKTNRPAPRRPEEVPAAYVRQLALYRVVLTRIYPDRPVRTALIWTEVPDLMEISAEALDRALTSL